MVPLRLNLELLRRPAEVPAPLAPEFDPLLRRARTAAFLRFEPSDADDPLATKLAGTPYLPEGEPWPTCDRCGRPMHHLFQINFARDGFPALEGVALLTFFYCIGCSPEDHTAPGWAVRLHADLRAPAGQHPLPPVPPQQEQPLPIILLHNRPQAGTVRLGPDLPDILDEGVQQVLDQIWGGEPFAGAARMGVTHYARIRIRQGGAEPREVTIPMTFAPDDPWAWVRQIVPHDQIEHVEVRPVAPPREPDPRDEYQALLTTLCGTEDRPVSKIGGWLHDAQTPRFDRCDCGEPLEHLVTIRSTIHTPFVVGDVGAIYLVACPSPDCRQGGLRWWADYF